MLDVAAKDRELLYLRNFPTRKSLRQMKRMYLDWSHTKIGYEYNRSLINVCKIANKNLKVAKSIGKLISTKYYMIEYSKDIIGVEVCSAIKNIYAMIIGAGQSLNSSSNLFQKSLLEMKFLTKYFKGKEVSTLGLAGVGDLYVSAAGGRNSKMGSYLGKGFTFKKAKKKFMPKDTVEGEQLAREIESIAGSCDCYLLFSINNTSFNIKNVSPVNKEFAIIKI